MVANYSIEPGTGLEPGNQAGLTPRGQEHEQQPGRRAGGKGAEDGWEQGRGRWGCPVPVCPVLRCHERAVAGPEGAPVTSERPSHCTWAWIHSSLSEFSFSRTPSFTCEHSSSAFSRACFRWLWSGWFSGVFSIICTQRNPARGFCHHSSAAFALSAPRFRSRALFPAIMSHIRFPP